MADAEHRLDFLEGGVGVFFDVGLELGGVELAPLPPARFRVQRTLLGGGQIPIDGTPGQIKTPGSFRLGSAALNEFHHPFPQVQRIGFHALNLISLCPIVYMKCYIPPFFFCSVTHSAWILQRLMQNQLILEMTPFLLP